ncbi:hypothetical protein [Bartonella sp. AC134YNZD]|uniref:hypothetical protein n=1 Tax=Bartonella sp. AC134YNZD TaxID=3243446 RepID=UPI0035D0D7A8
MTHQPPATKQSSPTHAMDLVRTVSTCKHETHRVYQQAAVAEPNDKLHLQLYPV